MKHTKVLIIAAAFTFVAALATMLFVGGVKAQTTPPLKAAKDAGTATTN